MTTVNVIFAAEQRGGLVEQSGWDGRKISGLLGALLSPIGLVVTALAGVALVVWKYWQPITAFLGGVVEGFKAAAGPSVQRLNHLSPCSSGLATKCRRCGAGLLIC
ncbi:TP901 family phage tail tape measure protein [Escherichia coli]|uniref:TP901 family phage tail tape measure protein n=1 Tax=Escherichia coli TaxID=562 RepID=A0A485JKW7_ECOLX|nr:TP901 family phage tail tape measure protein [Escherichia coli]